MVVSPRNHLISMQEYHRVLGPTLPLVYINDLSDGALSRIGFYADDTTAYSSIQTSDFFDKLEITPELLGLVFTPKLDWKPNVQSVGIQASQIVGLFFYLKDTLHLRPLCTCIKSPSGHVWSTAPILGLVLHNRVALICLIRSRVGWSIY